MGIELTTALVTAAVLVAVVALRSLSGGKIEVTLNDAVIAAIAAGLTLLVSGRISKLVVGSGGVTVETARQAILSASARPIEGQITKVPVAPIEMALKGGVEEIPELVRRQVEALEFLLGAGFYEPGALREYLETLSKYPFFRFVVFLNPDQTLFGMIDARKLAALLQDPRSGLSFAGFAALINSQAGDDRARLANLPGFVPADAGVTRQSDKGEVLAKMEERGADWLPVVQTREGRLEGIVDRSRLTASLILDVTNQLKALPPPQS